MRRQQATQQTQRDADVAVAHTAPDPPPGAYSTSILCQQARMKSFGGRCLFYFTLLLTVCSTQAAAERVTIITPRQYPVGTQIDGVIDGLIIAHEVVVEGLIIF